MSDEKFVRIKEAHNPNYTTNVVSDILSKGHNPEPIVQVVSQLIQLPNMPTSSEPIPSPQSSGGVEGQPSG